MISWNVCIATLDRPEVLKRAIGHVMMQTVPPVQIVVVDASDGWQEGRDAITALVAANPAIRLDYIHSEMRSSATQRNIGIRASIGDVVFIIDDDSFMYPDCAEMVLAFYGADPDDRLAAVQIDLVEEPPSLNDAGSDGPILRRKSSGNHQGLARYKNLVLGNRLGRWFHRRILMQSIEETFLRYDGPRQYPLPQALKKLGAVSLSCMPGCGMTVRREIALREPFDTALRYYAAGEDADVSYRYAKHGHVIHIPKARLHHFEVMGGRIDRSKVITFQLLNMVVFVKRHAAHPDDWRNPYWILTYRRVLSEFLKDLLSGRLTFPQMRGVLLARRYAKKVWKYQIDQLDTSYPTLQQHILEER